MVMADWVAGTGDPETVGNVLEGIRVSAGSGDWSTGPGWVWLGAITGLQADTPRQNASRAGKKAAVIRLIR